MNKNRPVFKQSLDDKLCKSILDGIENQCERSDKCKFSHDLKSYIENKPEDISDECPNYKKNNYCQYGITCRFGKNHLSEDNKNLNPSNVKRADRQNLPYELQQKLRKKCYDFSKSDQIIKEVEKEIQESKKLLGSVPSEEQVKILPEEKKKIDFANKLVLSPLTTVGNLPFRRICKEYGADITVGEMACALPLVNGSMPEWALTRRHESEDIFGVQICGNNAKMLTYATQLVAQEADVDFVDLNIGCPIDLIYQQGGGSALIRRTNILEQIVKNCSKVLDDKPFTVKTRTGIYADKSVAHDLMPKIESWGAAAITLHGRSREQRYTKLANWDYIEECASKVKRIPVIGNGDILTFDDYQRIREKAKNVQSVMIGRGALIKPWIFKEIKEQKTYDVSSKERFEMLQKYCNYGLTHWGSDTKGVETTRRFFLEWQSFLYRYVPYGILANPPQKIQQRPENDTYLGRDDLETLMSSNKSSDWLKISEMFLGKVPDGFQFLPKHKANSY
jgi:tRNA-dihydrouridine synthase 3